MKQSIFTTLLMLASTVFSQTGEKVPQCPTISLTGPATVVQPDEPFKFSLEISGGYDESKLKFIWKTEGGKIIKGQGTKNIEAVLNKCENLIKATIEIKGLPATCPNTISETGVISHNCELMNAFQIDGYGKIGFEEEKIKIDNLYKQFEKYPAAVGLIELQKNTNIINRIGKIDKYLTRKNYDKSLIYYVISDSARQNTALWIVPPAGVGLPDCDECEIINAEDTEKLNELFRSKTNK